MSIHNYHNASLVMVLGCMFSGKTTYLLDELNRARDIGFSTVFVNSDIDSRDETFSTHNEILTKENTCDVIRCQELCDVNVLSKLYTYDIIAIDEAQFFPDLYQAVITLLNKGKYVFVGGLNGTFEKKNFGQIAQLLPEADNIVFRHAYCANCYKKGKVTAASFSKRIIKETQEIMVGAAESYIPVCRQCFDDENST